MVDQNLKRNDQGWRINIYTAALPKQLAEQLTEPDSDDPPDTQRPQAMHDDRPIQVGHGPNPQPVRPNDDGLRTTNGPITSSSEQGKKQGIKNSVRELRESLRMPKPERRGPRFARNFDEIVVHVKKAIERGVPADDVEYLSRLTGLTIPQAEAALQQLYQDGRSINGSAMRAEANKWIEE